MCTLTPRTIPVSLHNSTSPRRNLTQDNHFVPEICVKFRASMLGMSYHLVTPAINTLWGQTSLFGKFDSSYNFQIHGIASIFLGVRGGARNYQRSRLRYA